MQNYMRDVLRLNSIEQVALRFMDLFYFSLTILSSSVFDSLWDVCSFVNRKLLKD